MIKKLQLLAYLLIVCTFTQCASPDDNASANGTPSRDETAQSDSNLAQTPNADNAQTESAQADESDEATAEAEKLAAKAKRHSPDSQYIIIPGDVLQITVWKEDELNQEVLVLNDGTINFPLIGTVQAQGLSTAELQDEIKDKLSKLVPDASVTVAVKAALGHTVNVIGQVTKPGELVMGHDLTVMQALSQAGGLTPYADDGRIIILRRVNGKETSIRFPYSDVASGDDLDKDIVLSPGDVIVVPTAGLL